jgi:outer membrane autotransporter protein
MGFGNGWFVEPQVEVSVFHASGASYRMSNDMRVVSGSGNSTLLRANALVGRRIELTNAKQVQPYVKFGWSHELDGKSVVTTNGIDTRTDLSGGRAELGAGVIAALGGRHRLYADYEYRKGSRFESPWGINAGYRYVW